MPAKKRKDGTYKDIAHPLNTDMRDRMERVILDEYERRRRPGAALPSPRPDGRLGRRTSTSGGAGLGERGTLTMPTARDFKVFAGNSNPALARADLRVPRAPAGEGRGGPLLRRRDPGRDRRERPRRRLLRRPVDLLAGERPPDGAADHVRRAQARVGRLASPRSSRTTATPGRTARSRRARRSPPSWSPT